MSPLVTDEPDHDGLNETLYTALMAHKVEEAGPLNSEMLSLVVRDGDAGLMAGLTGEMYWNALVIRQLWVAAPYRRRGLGRSLMLEAERRAIRRRCDLAYVSTFEFQGPEFYLSLGYSAFGALPIPPGSRLQWFRKDLRSREAGA